MVKSCSCLYLIMCCPYLAWWSVLGYYYLCIVVSEEQCKWQPCMVCLSVCEWVCGARSSCLSIAPQKRACIGLKTVCKHWELVVCKGRLWYSALWDSLGAGKKRDPITVNREFKDPSSLMLTFCSILNQISVSQSECGWSFKVSNLNQYGRVLVKEMLPTVIISTLSLCLLL
jgi:hypothetical protein